MAAAPHTALSYTLPPTRRAALPLPRVEPVRPSLLLRADAVFLIVASLAAFAITARGVRISGIGFGEAHELALITGVLLWNASGRRCWHLAAAALHALLAGANVAHWQALVSGSELAAFAATGAHAIFVVLQLVTAARSRR